MSTVTPTSRSTARQGLLSYDVLPCYLPDLFSPALTATSIGRLHGRYVRFSGATSGQSSIPLRAQPDLLREDPRQSESKRCSGALTGLSGRTGHRRLPDDSGVLQSGEESFVFRVTVFPDAWSGSMAMSRLVMMVRIHCYVVAQIYRECGQNRTAIHGRTCLMGDGPSRDPAKSSQT